jgi:hypothetical protein
VYSEDLNPFTHLATIPTGADLTTIRFEKARLVNLASRVRLTKDGGYCKELAFRDPGGSLACPYGQTETRIPAYEVTYSYTGQPLASDEYAVRNFTFSVYFRPDEFAPDLQNALSRGKLRRSDAAGYFALSTYREPAARLAIDDSHSHFCEGSYVDGAWVRADAGCKETISYTALTAPSLYVTVKVDPASSRVLRAATESAR